MTDLSSFLDISAINWSKLPVKVGRVVGLLDTNYSDDGEATYSDFFSAL